ncbi:lysoplasmalogenase [Lacinutrix sp. Bg11-31]|uniref:lysoplasmalogenase n=1 Tax=Lacinutrix sp. Bg11-31 TaxID=2057808 RepID=UPI000C318B6E|nr:lysoplasmalogenase [Lacinutrix sp. Bg11-31]AUC80941.1 lysoplasmalogenase [Lacinutrix sp. Bg11-31]
MKPTSTFSFYILFAIIVLFETLLASWLDLNWIHYISKPLVVISLIIFFLLNSKHLKKNIRMLTLLALVFSLLGDVLLLFVSESEYFFISGLIAFLIAHIFYCVVFLKHRDKSKKPYGFIALLLIYAFGIFWFLNSGLNDLLIPVILYMLVILAMATSAFLRHQKVGAKSYNLVFYGALVFMISDSLLALNKFYLPFSLADFGIMFTYALAQLLIVKGLIIQSDKSVL